MSSRSLSPRQARRVALAAQGFTRGRGSGTGSGTGNGTGTGSGTGGSRALRRVLQHTQLLQIDSVNVLQRAHYLPGWSRLGGYPTATLDTMAYKRRGLFEYWGHEASLMPMELHPLMRWRMRRAEQKFETWGRLAKLARERPDYIEHVYGTVSERGPVTAGELAEEERRGTDHWGWNWTDSKVAIEYLFWAGRVAVLERRNFERRYDVPERV